MPIKTFGQFLTENSRVEVLHDKFKNLLAPHVGRDDERWTHMWSQIVDADPSRNKQYLQWILNLIVKKNIQMSDLDKVKQDLEIFDRVKQRVPVERRDVNRYKAYQDLYDVVKEFGDTKGKNEEKREEIAKWKQQITTIYEGSEGRVYIPHTQEASCYLGRGTRWCTAATGSGNYFNSYNNRGKLYIFIEPDGEKFQYHATSMQDLFKLYNSEEPDFMQVLNAGEFMDSADRPVGPGHKFYKSHLFQKVLSLPVFSHAAFVLGLKSKDMALLRLAAKHYPELIKQMKGDAVEILQMDREGKLRKFQNVVNMYKMVAEI